MKRLNIIGSTGSIGTQTLDVARSLGCKVVSLAANKNITLLEEQIREFKPEFAVCTDETAAKELKRRVSDTKTEILAGRDELIRSVTDTDYDLLVNGIVGMAGTVPTVKAIESGHSVALANKEAIVTAGEIINRITREKNVSLISVDSEHSAIMQCIGNRPKQEIDTLILTASGGPFFGKTAGFLKTVTPEMALKHPNWSMGAKITVDSATLMNKGLEIIEAVRPFGIPESRIEVSVHRQSIVHSMVRFTDGAVIAQLSVPDMRLPIQYAITYPNRIATEINRLDFSKAQTLTFEQPDTKTFKAIDLARHAVRIGGTAPTVLNAANEIAVEAFLCGRIEFTDIADIVEERLNSIPVISDPSLEEIIETDAKIRRQGI